MTTENHILPLIDTYLTGGLDDAETRAFDAHVATCGDCAAVLEIARAADAKLVAALAGAVPGPAFEDRLVGALRPQFSRPSLVMRLSRPIHHPMVRRIAVGVAASLVIGTVGYGMSVAVDGRDLRRTDEIGVLRGTGFHQEYGVRREADSDGRAFSLRSKLAESNDVLNGSTDVEQTLKPQSREMGYLSATKEGMDLQSTDPYATYFGTQAGAGSSGTNASNYYNFRWGEARDVNDRSPTTGGPTGTTSLARTDGTKGVKNAEDGVPSLQSNESAVRSDSNAPRGSSLKGKAEKRLEEASKPSNGPVALDIPDFSDAPNFNLQSNNGGTVKGRSAGSSWSGHNSYTGGTTVSGGTLQLGTDVPIEGKLGTVALSPATASPETKSKAADTRGWAMSTSGDDNGKWYRPTQLSAAGVESEIEKLKDGRKDQLKSLADVQKVTEGLAADGPVSKRGLGFGKNGNGTLTLGDQVEVADIDGEAKGGDKKSGSTNGDRAKVLSDTTNLFFDADKKETASAAQEKAPATPAPKPVAPAPAEVPPPEVQVRKIIRNGVVNFEVDSFDSALVQVSKLVTEEGGYVATTSSDKLPNGKVRGSVTVRVPPERLDTLVLKLRGMGDLKNQRIGAEDVTKRYTDIASQLRAALAMEKRLLDIIAKGGEVKDLLEAEKQLGVWREKLELLQGEIKYYDNLVALATLVVELQEREVRSPTAAFEVETVNTAVESEDVENVRSEVLKAIDQAKGRVIDSDLKKLEAGQLSATIKASVSPDAAGPVIDRLKQLGKLARLDISRKTATEGGSGPIVAGLRVEKRETQFEIHIYNLANIEPRQTTTLNLAAQDVEATYKLILEQVKSSGGTIKTSQLNRPRADQTSGTIVFQVQADKADVLLGAVRAGVDVMRMDVAINPDTQNTTEAKRGFSLQIMSLSQVPARETTTLQVAAADVPTAFRKLLDAATNAGGRVVTSQLNEQDANNITGQLEFETSREKWSTVEGVLRESGAIISRSAVRSNDTETTVDSKIRLSIGLVDEIRLSPRETINATVATRTVQDTFDKLVRAAKDAGARVVGSNLNLADRANPNGTLRFATPRDNATKFEQAMKDAGLTTSRATARLPDGPMTVENKIGYIVTVVDERTLQPRESHSMVVVAPSAKDRYNKLVDALRITDALVVSSQLSVQNRTDITGSLVFVINRSDREIIEQVLSENTDVFNRSIERSQDTQGTVDTKIRYSLSVKEAGQQPPRQVFQLTVETSNIDKAIGDLEAAAIAAGGRKIEAERARQDRKDGARVVVDVPLAAIGQLITSVRSQGEVTANQSRQNENIPEGLLSRSRVEITYATPATVASEKGFGESLREGMSGALTGLFKVLQWVIFGLVVIVPCMVVIWIGFQLVRLTQRKGKKSSADTFGPTPNPT